MKKILIPILSILIFTTCKKTDTKPADPVLATITTTAASAITDITATSGGNITSDGGSAITTRGVCWNTSANPTITNSKTSDATGTGNFISSLTGLTVNTTYYVRAYATNSAGTAYGNEVSFTTSNPVLATITTTAASGKTPTSATSGGNITSDGGSAITERGICFNTSTNPTTSNNKVASGSGTGVFTATITGLTQGTTFYVRAYAVNSAGTAYGNEVSFALSDRFCAEKWMSQNLNVITYRNGDTIPQVTDSATWMSLTTGAWCYYNNDPANEARYGKLYNWYAVNDPRGLAPAGWHIPSDAEWKTFSDCLGGVPVGIGAVSGGGKMKSTGTFEAGTGLWMAPNTEATNSTGFTGLPGGWRGTKFFSVGVEGSWWSSSLATNGTSVIFRLLGSNHGAMVSYATGKTLGISVRCIRD